jgi:hypothetical protein
MDDPRVDRGRSGVDERVSRFLLRFTYIMTGLFFSFLAVAVLFDREVNTALKIGLFVLVGIPGMVLLGIGAFARSSRFIVPKK